MQRDESLGVARGAGRDGADDQAVPVLRKRVTHEAELGLLARTLVAEQLDVQVGRGGMRVVAALLAPEVLLAVVSHIGGQDGSTAQD
ncbi:hypothetical protein JMJ56_17720 [Belnapia sp. T18]|uniref:Uncharacterized protein n=1 Tax=Belnapia arida TaxID=2804533 RepID=A0ABS1U5B0_9PROT|nr:hypothetical protein [Belnapia arida]MBL6079861.1 hypothetical protein [Belnapia arida]